jgi:hypothetical protein
MAVVALTLALPTSTAWSFEIGAAAERDSHIYFATDEPLLPALDTDSSVDIYDRFDGELFLATGGDSSCQPGCGNGEFDVDPAGGIRTLSGGGLLFSTAESLSPADTDGGAVDVYLRTAQGPQLLSTASGAPNSPDDATLDSHGEDGAVIVFSTAEQLVPQDTDGAVDVYRRAAGATTLISQGEEFNGPYDAIWAASSRDQSAIFFRTAEQLEENDTDASIDLYRRSFGETNRISRGAGGLSTGNGEFDVGPKVMVSEEGRVVFETSEQLQEKDVDEEQDVYMNFGGTITDVSQGSYNAYTDEYPAQLNAIDPSANQVLFSSKQALNIEDKDVSGADVFEWFYDKTILSSQGNSIPISTTPSLDAQFLDYVPVGLGRIIFQTPEQLLAGDTDSSPDIYERVNKSLTPTEIFKRVEGVTRLVSQGLDGFNGPYTPTYRYDSPDGEEIFFTTRERLVGEDTDSSIDLYVRSGASTTELLSTGLINGNGPYDVIPLGGFEHPLFVTSEQLVRGDLDNQPDLYQRDGRATRLVSTAKPGPPAPTITGSSPASPGNSLTPAIRGEAEADSIVEIFDNPSCTGEALASGPAAQFAVGGIPVSVPRDTATTVYARTNDIENNRGPCSEGFTYLEDSTPPGLSGAAVQPRSPANDNRPVIHGSTEPDSVVRVFGDPACGGDPLATGSGAQLGASGISAQVADDATTRFSLTSTDIAGNVSGCVGPLEYVEDSTPPRTRIVSGPRKKRSRSRSPLFQLASNEEEATFSCRLDRRAPIPCSSFAVIRKVGRGRHVLSVVATDEAGNADATPARWRWRMVPAQPRRHRHRGPAARR